MIDGTSLQGSGSYFRTLRACQTSADRAWLAIARFYNNCREHQPGKKGYPRFQKDNRSVEYKAASGWKLEPGGEHLTFTDGYDIGRVKLVGPRSIPDPLFPGKHLVFSL